MLTLARRTQLDVLNPRNRPQPGMEQRQLEVISRRLEQTGCIQGIREAL